jgi:hypothetical protein
MFLARFGAAPSLTEAHQVAPTDRGSVPLSKEHHPDTQERTDRQELEKLFANHADLMLIQAKVTSGALLNSGTEITLPVLRLHHSLKP